MTDRSSMIAKKPNQSISATPMLVPFLFVSARQYGVAELSRQK
jgi:hypothetical protein